VYADPPLPWQPTATSIPLAPRVENAGNIMARTFVDAHAQDWCEVLHEDGDDEFSLAHLRGRCTDANEEGDGEVACGICERFATWMVSDPEPADGANLDLAEPPLCVLLTGREGIEAESEAGDFDRRALAKRWCEDAPIYVLVAASTEVQYQDFISYCQDLVERRFQNVVAEDRAPPCIACGRRNPGGDCSGR
jgi:hypothetical protein